MRYNIQTFFLVEGIVSGFAVLGVTLASCSSPGRSDMFAVPGTMEGGYATAPDTVQMVLGSVWLVLSNMWLCRYLGFPPEYTSGAGAAPDPCSGEADVHVPGGGARAQSCGRNCPHQ
jgi:hypothetical protein